MPLLWQRIERKQTRKLQLAPDLVLHTSAGAKPKRCAINHSKRCVPLKSRLSHLTMSWLSRPKQLWRRLWVQSQRTVSPSPSAKDDESMEQVRKKRRKENVGLKEERRTRIERKVRFLNEGEPKKDAACKAGTRRHEDNEAVRRTRRHKKESRFQNDVTDTKVYKPKSILKQDISRLSASALSTSPATAASVLLPPSTTSLPTKAAEALASEAPCTTSSESSNTTAPCPYSASTATDSTITPCSAPFTEGEEILVHLEDGLIYLGVVVEVDQEQKQWLVRFGDGTEHWSTFKELQRLDGSTDDKCTQPSTPACSEPVGIEEESSDITSQAFEDSVDIPEEAQPGHKQFSCSFCDYFCSRSVVLKRHMKVHAQEKPSNEKPYSCTRCDYSCSKSNNLTTHIRIHTGKKPYTCIQCDYSCAQSSNLKQHMMRVHTGEKPYSCTKCDYSCSRSTDLKTHMRVHTGKKPYSCTDCDYSCSTSKYLKIHLRVHSGEKPYSCTQCNYSCAQLCTLKRHMRVHTGDKPYNCAHCDYSCSQLQHLKRHIKMHTGEKPYSCTQCDYSSSRSDNLMVHMRLHAGDKPHTCTHCDYSSSYSNNLKRHMSEHH